MAYCADISKMSLLAFPGKFYSRSTQLATKISLGQKKGPTGAFAWRMLQDLDKTDKEIGIKATSLLLASEKYIEGSIKAIKAGKIIAVPTDTVYGFACDAWYVM